MLEWFWPLFAVFDLCLAARWLFGHDRIAVAPVEAGEEESCN